MPLKAIIFMGLFAICVCGAVFTPILGVLGYMGHYCVGPERQWWSGPFRSLGIRYSYLLALLTVVGVVTHWQKLRLGKRLFHGHEKMMLLFLGIVWLSVLLAEGTTARYTTADHPSVKLTKVVVFVLLMTHVVTDMKNVNRLLWVLVIGAMILGMQAYDTPRSAFRQGRLESVGGPDFSDANRLAGFLAGLLFIIGVQFLRSKWKGKVICFLAGGFTANAIILCRSRGALVGVFGGGLVATFMAPKRHRSKILVGLVLAGLGGLYLMDPGFMRRSATITRADGERDEAAQSRIVMWRGGAAMVADRPLGVGAGLWRESIGRYVPEYPDKDAHNTFVRCAGELGVHGVAVLVIIVINAVRLLRRIMKRAHELPDEARDKVLWAAYGMATGLAAILCYGMTGTLVYTEYLWWFLALPVCLARVVENIQADQLLAVSDTSKETSAKQADQNSARTPAPSRRTVAKVTR